MSEPTVELPFLETPRDGIPPLIETDEQLSEVVVRLAAGDGPVAFDAERAHGHRYHPKSYLFQLRRRGTGSALIDPIAFEIGGRTDLGALVTAVGDAEWVLHAASQDLPCMIEDGIVPASVFDTELAARLLNYPQVGLAALVERHFGYRLRKAHSADDWSKRPLPESWLSYAALDVELLLELRDLLSDELTDKGKHGWADEEFAYVLASALAPQEPKTDRWRRMSGLRDVRSRRGLAVAHALWLARDSVARQLDRPTGRLLPDAGIVALAATVGDTGPLPTLASLRTITEFNFRGARRFTTNWMQAINSVEQLSPTDFPQKRPPRVDVGQPRNWGRNFPEAAARWERTRAAVDARAEQLDVPPAQLIQPAVLREVVFTPPDDIAARLAELGARTWQRDLVTPVLAETLRDTDERSPR